MELSYYGAMHQICNPMPLMTQMVTECWELVTGTEVVRSRRAGRFFPVKATTLAGTPICGARFIPKLAPLSWGLAL